ncbi:hypothetical protein JXB22_09630 [candidate division WOR-3 bacterium]|nr:hypothetical protein [candidate division WOR-3 bacterium]
MSVNAKLLYALIALLIFSGVAHAVTIQPVIVIPREREVETLVHDRPVIGLFGGPVLKFSYLDDRFAFLVGGRGGISFCDLFAIGGGGYGLVNEIAVPFTQSPYEQYLSFGYGGVILEFLIASHKVTHLSMHALIGGGSLYYHDYYWRSWGDDVFFVLEPGMDLELNVSRCFRIGMGGTYRFVSGVSVPEFTSQDMSGFSAALTFKFGRF